MKIANNRIRFNEELAIRMQNTQIECTDAIRIIHSRDTSEAFFYLDPPYFNSDCGHYDGYSERDFRELLEACSRMQGKFLLSSYPSDVLKEFTKANEWHQTELQQRVSVNKGYGKKKVEVLTANYPI